MFALRYLIRKFFEMKMYWVNSFAKNCSLILTIAKNSLNEFLKVGGGVLLYGFAKLSDWDVLENSFTETFESVFSFSESDLFMKSEFCEMLPAKLIVAQ